ncbi:MAG: DUF4160 domain-containing protein [Shimia sp.]
MYQDDHPPPHFHVRGPGFDASVDLATFEVTAGRVERRALREACDWVDRNRDLMEDAWDELNPT